jgi:lipopolysaccharide/colanic/teichoic acid biosynthesis glycosyltransferase
MENVVVLPWVNEPATLYRAMDVLVLPTYREGFPNVVLEAQASGVPVITTDATGAVDSVIDQETGIIVPVGNVDRLAAALQELARDPVKAATMGAAGRKRVERVFSQEKVWTEIGNFFACQIDRSSRQIGWRALVKSVADRVFSLMLLLLLSPVLLIVGLMVRVALGSPAVFVQERLGYRGKLIRVHKFRTMSDQRDRSGNLLPDAERLGTLGRLLRALSLDELPQLWDVVRGDLSFIGPRPLLVRYRERYSPEQWRRHNVKPGISGWAQVNGRNAITWEQKFALDVWYVDHWSLWLDLRILLMTLVKTVRREGISFGGDATMPEFNPSARSSAQGE